MLCDHGADPGLLKTLEAKAEAMCDLFSRSHTLNVHMRSHDVMGDQGADNGGKARAHT